MTVQIELINGSCVRVVSRGLDLLLERRLVSGFMRSSGWVVVGVDPIRSCTAFADYSGVDRRRRADC